MMLAPSGEKLSKRHGAVSVGEYRDQGFAPRAVLNYLVRFGWSHGDREVFSLGELVEAFDWEGCNRSDGKFDAKKFRATNHAHLKSDALMPAPEYAERVAPFLEKRGLGKLASREVEPTVPLVRERAETFVDAADRLDFVFREPPVVEEAAAAKFLVAANAPRLRELAAVLAKVEPWTAPALEAATHAWLTAANLQIKDVAQPARVALTGRTASPGLYDVLAILGKERALARLTAAAEASERRG
jgi:glutamyl-tRNA synthetase